MALLEGDRGDAQERPAGGGPGRELGGVDGRLRDVQPVSGERVQLQQPLPCPRAGRHDGCGSRGDRTLHAEPLTASATSAAGRAVPPAACARARPCAGAALGARAPRRPARRPAHRAARRLSSGIRRSDVGEGLANDAASGRGQQPGTVCSCTAQPQSELSPRHRWRSYALPPLGRLGSSMPSGTTTCTAVTTGARSSPRRCATRAE